MLHIQLDGVIRDIHDNCCNISETNNSWIDTMPIYSHPRYTLGYSITK